MPERNVKPLAKQQSQAVRAKKRAYARRTFFPGRRMNGSNAARRSREKIKICFDRREKSHA